MARPTSKAELLEQAHDNYDKLKALIASYPKEKLDMNFPKGTLNRNVRDVLMHLDAWHLMLLEWEKIGSKGGKPDMPAKGYTWQTLPALNKKIWKDTQSVTLQDAQKLIAKSNKKVLKLINAYSDTEIFTKKLYPWTGSTSLGAYLISNSCSHYNWAYKLIKKQLK